MFSTAAMATVIGSLAAGSVLCDLELCAAQQAIESKAMSLELKVPEVGESVTEVYIGKWYKSEGDEVAKEEQLVELESDKATLDLRAPEAGVLTKILKNTGETADIGEVIGHLEENGNSRELQTTEAEPREEEQPPRAKESKTHEEEPQPKREEKTSSLKTQDSEEKKLAPVAKEIDEIETKNTDASQSQGQKRQPRHDSGRDEERVVMSPVRRRIAERLVAAQKNMALLTTFNEIDMTAVKELRSLYGDSFEQRHGMRLGFMSFFVKAVIGALEQCRELNAIIEDEEIVYRQYYDIGVAISTDKGLIVPVLRDANKMDFAEIEKVIDDYAKRARAGELKVDELQGGTFTITNGGVFGSLLSTPIINPPQSGVLGMHAIQNRPVARGGEVVIRPMMYVALTYDHRIVDGREAVTYLARIKETIEEPARLLIAV